MNSSIVLKAQTFCAEHFCDNTLDMDSYMLIIDNYLDEIPQPEEKVQFLIEVKRIGGLIIEDSLTEIGAKERYEIGQYGDQIFGRNLSRL